MKSQLDGVKKTLAETRRATQIEFICFRKEKEKTATKPAASEDTATAPSHSLVTPAKPREKSSRRPITPNPRSGEEQPKPF